MKHQVIIKGVLQPDPMTVDEIRSLAKQKGLDPYTCYDNGYSCISYDRISWEFLASQDHQRIIYLMFDRPATEVSFS
jgi:hypothetical protein